MKTRIQLVLGTTLLALCAHAGAEWVEVERFEDNTRVYVDRKTARRDGDVAQVLHLVRWGEAQTDPGLPPYLSTIVRTDYHCIEKRERYLASTSYAGAMGNGASVVADHDEAESWYSISSGSMEEKLLKVACGND